MTSEVIDTVPGWDTSAVPPAEGPKEPAEATRYHIEFTGSGSEYFKIWIVNLLLTIVTVGIYSAWAKVRRLRYFYGNTHLAGSTFDFHGKPTSILLGRIIAAVLFALYSASPRLPLFLEVVIAVSLIAIFPWLFWRSQKFRLGNSSYRGVRFRFMGALGGSYALFIPAALLVLAPQLLFQRLVIGRPPSEVMKWLPFQFLIFGLELVLFPLFYWALKRYQHAYAGFGTARFSFDARIRSAYWMMTKILLVYFGSLFVVGLGFGVFGIVAARNKPLMFALLPLFLIAGGLSLSILTAYATTRMQNFIWSHTALSNQPIHSGVRFRDVFKVHVVNFLGTLFTLGLFYPFAAVRYARVHLHGISWRGDPEVFAAHAADTGGATGSEFGDFLGFDIGL